MVWSEQNITIHCCTGYISINKMLQREVVKNRDMQQVKQSLTEGPVCEVDKVLVQRFT